MLNTYIKSVLWHCQIEDPTIILKAEYDTSKYHLIILVREKKTPFFGIRSTKVLSSSFFNWHIFQSIR